MRIIIVEDHDALREATTAVLTDMGHVVASVGSAEEVDLIIKDFQPQVLVLDLNLPGEDGVSLAQRLRLAYPQLGIVMVTTRAELEHRVLGYDSGADIYLTKPTAPQELKAAIEALSRRLTTWAGTTPQLHINLRELRATERARVIHQQLTSMMGKLPTQEDLSRHYACPYRTLNQEFQNEYGQTISAYMIEYRLNQARKALLETDIPIKVIAAHCGYSHAASFSVAFLARFGCPPGYLRNKRSDLQKK